MTLGLSTLVRKALRVRGLVQGVGFRPFVYRLARETGLAGFVRNDASGVWIELEGDSAAVTEFPGRLRSLAPAAVRIESIETFDLPASYDRGFSVGESLNATETSARIPPDLATCGACLTELFDPANRRYRYPFINCTDCGPRFTIVRELPYDRQRTTMDSFKLCRLCRDEYENPDDRRFHAEPNACKDCGPQLSLEGARGEEALAGAIAALRAGKIVAVKGIGGFHLAVDAANGEAVERLRRRKHRPHKPFALMVRDVEFAATIAAVDDVSRATLLSAPRPIVLLPLSVVRYPLSGGGDSRSTENERRTTFHTIAPALDEIGLMLPYSPLHHLLLEEIPILVMTSGNRADEPIAADNDEAIDHLSDIADVFLLHDRDIHSRADDSVIRIVDGKTQPVRRSRGYVPEPMDLGIAVAPILAVGAELKKTVCITRGREAFLSQHIGESVTFMEEAIAGLSRLLSVKPVVVAHDLHPDYASTRWALASGLPRIAVQHHHAHIASCLAEHQTTGPVIGVAFDGTGCGPAGELWGGEILLADALSSQRLFHLQPIALIGGEAAIRQPWRLALAALDDAGIADEGAGLLPQIDRSRRDTALAMLRKKLFTPESTSAGRWFDAVAALCSVRDEISYEAQAAIELEALLPEEDGQPYRFALELSRIDLRPTIRDIASDLRAGVTTPVIAARFHETMARAITAAVTQARLTTGLSVVALSGGCFQNRRLSRRTSALLKAEGFEVLQHRLVPPNDGGIALGQAFVAAHRLKAYDDQGGSDVSRYPR